jgi:hypothetical protein
LKAIIDELQRHHRPFEEIYEGEAVSLPADKFSWNVQKETHFDERRGTLSLRTT